MMTTWLFHKNEIILFPEEKQARMNDLLKIKVLMIYYDHWGKDEIKARKTAHGINKTLSFLTERFQTEDRTVYDGLKRMFNYLCNEDLLFLWTDFIEIFLQDLGGSFESLYTDDPYDDDEMLFDRKIMLENHLNILNDDTADIIYDNDFGYREALSVDAIVALLWWENWLWIFILL